MDAGPLTLLIAAVGDKPVGLVCTGFFCIILSCSYILISFTTQLGSVLSNPFKVADWMRKGNKGIMILLILNATDGGTGYKT